jgi:hypothetical protein
MALTFGHRSEAFYRADAEQRGAQYLKHDCSSAMYVGLGIYLLLRCWCFSKSIV